MPGERLPERLSPLAARFGLRPWYGDLHNHCDISYGHGSLDQALTRARRQLDFVSVTGHAYWPDMPVDDASVAHIVDFHVKGFARLAAGWDAHMDTLAAADVPGAFTVFPGYEIHSFAHGDYTIVYRDIDRANQIIKADSPAELHGRLRAAHGDGVFAFPHHIGYRLGARGVNWGSFIEDLSPVLEILSMHGCSEASLTDRPFLHSMGPSDGYGTARHGLSLGCRFGFLGNTDHHSGYPGSYGHGRSAVYAPEHSRAALWDGLHARRTTALTGDCCHLFVAAGDVAQGGSVPAGVAALEVEAVAGSFIDYIDVIRNGDVVARVTPDLHPAPLDVSGGLIESLLVLELGWGARGSTYDWTGVLEVIDGEILAVEPRLRGAEVVSPLEGAADAPDVNRIDLDGARIAFVIRSAANPNNTTQAMQGLAARVRLRPEARIRLTVDGQVFEAGVDRLLAGAMSGNLGPIDSPAFRLNPLPRPHQWQWHGRIAIPPMAAGDWAYVRMRQANGQWAWASPVFCT